MELKKKLFEVFPALAHVYQSTDNPIIRLFWVVGQVDFYRTGPQASRALFKSIELK
jgi:uncharacterized pyridoxamine 5'-phosphate oxidase family protein